MSKLKKMLNCECQNLRVNGQMPNFKMANVKKSNVKSWSNPKYWM